MARTFRIPEEFTPHRTMVIIPAAKLCELFLETGADADEETMWRAWSFLLQRLHRDGYVTRQRVP